MSLHDVDVAALGCSRHEPDAGIHVVLLHGLGDDAPLPRPPSSTTSQGDIFRLSLVELLNYCPLIGRELQSVAGVSSLML